MPCGISHNILKNYSKIFLSLSNNKYCFPCLDLAQITVIHSYILFILYFCTHYILQPHLLKLKSFFFLILILNFLTYSKKGNVKMVNKNVLKARPMQSVHIFNKFLVPGFK